MVKSFRAKHSSLTCHQKVSNLPLGRNSRLALNCGVASQRMKTFGDLVLEELTLQPGQEWSSPRDAWSFLLIRRGAAYWLSHEVNRALVEGEMLVIPPSVSGSVRASQLNELLLWRFRFTPWQLCGFFTVSERHFFEIDDGRKEPRILFLPSNHPVTQRFSAIRNEVNKEGSLKERAEALGVVAAVFEEQIGRHRLAARPAPTAGHRFEQIIARMPDSEMINHTPE